METVESPVLLLLDLPHNSLAGIDLLSFTTTPRFRGVKYVPPGWHFAFAGTSTAFSERHGVLFNIEQTRPPPLVVVKWDAGDETLLRETDEAQLLQWRANLGSIWREGLTPYRQATGGDSEDDSDAVTGDWQILTSSITDSLLKRITQDTSTYHLSSASSSKRDLEDIPGLNSEDLNLKSEQELHFLPIDLKQTWREGATGRERTDAAQDRSWALQHLVENHCTDEDALEVVGEMQFCFLMVLTISNFSCMEQWRRILTLLFTCKNAVVARSEFFVSAIAALRLQLQHCKDAEGGLIDLADESGSLLKSLLVRFRKGVESLSSVGVQDVVDELDDLEDYLRQEHGWQFGGNFVKTGVLELEDGEQVRMDTTAYDEEDETGEFAPQIVDLTPEQMKMLDLAGSDGTEHRPKIRTTESVSDGENSHESEESEAGDLEDMDARF